MLSRSGAWLACRRVTRAQYTYGFDLEQAGWGVVAAVEVADSVGQQVSESVRLDLWVGPFVSTGEGQGSKISYTQAPAPFDCEVWRASGPDSVEAI